MATAAANTGAKELQACECVLPHSQACKEIKVLEWMDCTSFLADGSISDLS